MEKHTIDVPAGDQVEQLVEIPELGKFGQIIALIDDYALDLFEERLLSVPEQDRAVKEMEAVITGIRNPERPKHDRATSALYMVAQFDAAAATEDDQLLAFYSDLVEESERIWSKRPDPKTEGGRSLVDCHTQIVRRLIAQAKAEITKKGGEQP